MASGLGLKGNVGRCYNYFEDFASCMKLSEDPLAKDSKGCVTLRDDYLECLHNKKEFTRVQAVRKEEKLQKEGGGSSHGGGDGGHGH